MWVLVMVVQVLGKHMIIGHFDPQVRRKSECLACPETLVRREVASNPGKIGNCGCQKQNHTIGIQLGITCSLSLTTSIISSGKAGELVAL